MAASLSRVGGGDLTATLFFDGDKAQDLLSSLGMASKIADQSQGLYTRAVQDQNTAQSLTDQANVAKQALKGLADAAQQAMEEAQAAADAAAAALKEQQDKNATLQAQLATLTTNRLHTESEYNAGVQAAIAKAEAERKAAAQAGGGGSGGIVSPSGWTRPSSGVISSNYGPRAGCPEGCSTFHEGTDFAPGCNAPIYAAHAGTVTYAAPAGGYGNYIVINDHDGITTAYGHIVSGGMLVSVGQNVGAGQVIARVGATGTVTGCNLHFEVRVNGSTVDPVPFLRARGVSV
jgi:murein DD-endopeptidase MepM/ murein hydrolase activator NlpD